MKILVTGGAGFIGSHLTDALIKKGHQVTVWDNLNTGSKENLNPAADFKKIDLKNFPKTAELFWAGRFEAVFHLAAQTSVRKSVANPQEDARDNILASLNLIELCKKNWLDSGSKNKFIFSSTGGAIYGDTDKRPSDEELKENPLSPYGIGKLAIDKYLNYYRKFFNLNCVSLRYANVYGPRQNPHGEAGVVAIFINKMIKGKQPLINGDGKQTRDYVHVDDVVRANLLALEKNQAAGIFNVGTALETNVNQLFEKINKHFDNRFKKKHGPGLAGEQKTSCLLFKKIEKELDWRPKIVLDKGIEQTWEWFLKKAKHER
ncbi:MAG: NAD-dependent epimerase/dehydratase family protein [Patescibacteria group bacterium]|nr:NAD-dependent epimerase/dehydratase family protein [Patescibacteria group bacterium]